MRTWSIKTAQCERCGDDFTWKTRKGTKCPACIRAHRREYQQAKRGPAKYATRGAEADKLPAVDWVMERQFAGFFALIGKRYDKMTDVSRVIDGQRHQSHRKVKA